MSQDQPITMSNAAIEELDAFLLSENCDEETLTVDEAHGLITAMLISPAGIVGNDWVGLIWGEPEFPDEATEQRMIAHLQQMEQEIRQLLEQGLPYEPFSVEEEEGDEVIESFEGWCFGFMVGVSQQQEAWDDLPKDQQALLAPMAQLSLLVSEEEPSMDDQEYQSWVELIPGAVTGLYNYCH